METDLDVLVVGGGPVGLFCAHELCRHGVSPKRIRIIDKRPKQSQWAKACAIQSRSLEIMYASSQSLSSSFQKASLKSDNFTLLSYAPDCAQNNKSFKDNKVLLKSNFSGLRSKFNYMAIIKQPNTENFIYNELNNKYNVKLERGIELIGFEDKGSYVNVKLAPYKKHRDDDVKSDNDDVEILRVKYLIGCDGAHSFVRSKLDLSFIGETYHQKFIVFHGELNDDKNELPDPAFFVASGINGFIFMIRLIDHSWYIVADLAGKQKEEYLKSHPNKSDGPTNDDFNKMFKERGLNGITVKSAEWKGTFMIDSRQIGQYSKGRVYLAGDACHIHSPLGGQGMNMGLQDAGNLAWKLAMVINKKCSASLLTSYNTERYNVDKSILKLIDRVSKGQLLRGSVALFFKETFQRAFGSIQFILEAFAEITGQITYSYRNYSELSFEYFKPPSFIPYVLFRRQQNITRLVRNRLYSGDRAPDFVIPAGSAADNNKYGNCRLYELFRDTQNKPFVILLFEGNTEFNVPFTDYTGNDLNKFKKYIESSECGEYCKIIIIPSSYRVLNQLYGVFQQCLFLIRPDQYIGLRSQPFSLRAIRYYLTKKLYINNIRIDDNEMLQIKNMESIDPIPTIIVISAIAISSYFIGNKVLPTKYKPKNIVSRISKIFWK